MFDVVLDGWRVHQASRHLEPGTVKQRTDLVRRAVGHLGEWRWEWTPLAVEEFIVDVAANGQARPTIRTSQDTLKVFLEYGRACTAAADDPDSKLRKRSVAVGIERSHLSIVDGGAGRF